MVAVPDKPCSAQDVDMSSADFGKTGDYKNDDCSYSDNDFEEEPHYEKHDPTRHLGSKDVVLGMFKDECGKIANVLTEKKHFPADEGKHLVNIVTHKDEGYARINLISDIVEERVLNNWNSRTRVW